MGIYLPTISFLIEPNEVPKKQLETYNDIIQLLEKYHKKLYQCTTKGYNHLELFRRMITDFNLPKADFYQKECAVAINEECIILHQSLKTIEQFILNDTTQLIDNLVKQEKRLMEMIFNNNRLNKKTKDNYRQRSIERIEEITNFSFAKYYAEAIVSKDISQYDQSSEYADNEYKVLLHWLKTQIFIVNKAITNKKALIHVMITP